MQRCLTCQWSEECSLKPQWGLRDFYIVKNFKDQCHQVLANVWVKVYFHRQLVGLKIAMKFRKGFLSGFLKMKNASLTQQCEFRTWTCQWLKHPYSGCSYKVASCSTVYNTAKQANRYMNGRQDECPPIGEWSIHLKQEFKEEENNETISHVRLTRVKCLKVQSVSLMWGYSAIRNSC